MTATVTLSDDELRPHDRKRYEVEAGHIVNELARGGLRRDAMDHLAGELDRLRTILSANRYETFKRRAETATESEQ